ncbi:MAG: FAD-dependent oxidoreductase [Haliea sp.]|nr:MAG: FAD-dependent oxidoreductase [Haliea sp.]
MKTLTTRCCIAGGGPAGMMLGLLLARAGVDVLVLEKHADFLRDFRGDTVHPSTLQVMRELRLLDRFLARPHDAVQVLRAVIGNEEVTIADFSRLRTGCPFIAMMPQWEFLDFLRDEAETCAGFRLIQGAEVTSLLQTRGRVTGVLASTAEGPLGVMADLVIGADGRHSVVRQSAGLTVRELGAPIDVLWMRLPKMPGDAPDTGGRIGRGLFLAMINRGSYWQCAYVIPKGSLQALQARGLPAFRADLARLVPMFADRTGELRSWDDIKLLTVTVDRLETWWRPGLLCIGDAAHAMSPIGGVGINLAIQDAVAAANLLAGPLADADVSAAALTSLLPQVQKRRLLPARITQAVQVAIQNRVLAPVLDSNAAGNDRPLTVPWPLRLMNRFPVLLRLTAYAVGVGVRPEHVQSPRV